jgi:gamma-glutamyl-gamma-aminobutyrate hydrolase PuuD
MKKVYIEGHGHKAGRGVEGTSLYRAMFIEKGWSITTSLVEADLLCMVGGSDVTPQLYGEENKASHSDEETDIHSLGLITFAGLMAIPVIGVCRGGQILNVSEGGAMKQHIDGHGFDHDIIFRRGVIPVTSTHHQEMIPPIDAIEIYNSLDDVVEVVVHNSGDVSVQGHPEYPSASKDFKDMFFDLIEEMC